MLHTIVDLIVNTVWDWGYTGIFIMMMVESSFIPFPSELAMIPAGYLSSTGEMSFMAALLFGTAWALFGAVINYFLGMHFGGPTIKHMIKKYGKYILLNEDHYKKSNKYFKKHGAITTLIGRFIPAVRQLISLPAGIFRMDMSKFLLYTAIGAGTWNLILLTIWYIAGENKELIKQYSGSALFGILLVAVLMWVIYYHFIKKETKKA